MRRFLLAAPLGLVVALLAWTRGDACCTAFPPGPDTKVAIASQEILVSWSPDTKIEHFVRQASFESRVPGFGFLVPTPTRPALSEVRERVFERLREEIEPRVVYQDRWIPMPGACCLLPFTLTLAQSKGMRGGATMTPVTAVEVLEQTRVAGFDAAVLSATDADALADWLKQNGYDARPALREWIEPYVAGGWIVTAFKFAAAQQGDVETGSLRMSFQTERPLFPYRVPTDLLVPPEKGNTLRVFFVGSGRATGALGPKATKWAGEAKYASGTPRVPLASLLGSAVPAADLPSGAWLTAFEDTTWPSGTEDLWFTSDPQGAELIPTIVVYEDKQLFIPLDLIAVAIIGPVLLVRRARRKRLEEKPAK